MQRRLLLTAGLAATAALADKSLNQTLKWYASWDLLLVDEFGFDRVEREECPQAAHLLYKVVHARHQTPAVSRCCGVSSVT